MSKKYNFLVISILLLFILQTLLTKWVGVFFSYFDEIFALLGLFMLIIKPFSYIKKNFRGNVLVWKNCIFIIIIIGILSSLRSDLQPFGVIWLNDIFTFMKVFLVFVLTHYWSSKCNIYSVCKILSSFLKFYIILSFVFCVLNQLVDIPALYDDGLRFGIKDYRFFHANAGDYSSVLVCVIALLHLLQQVLKKDYRIFLFMAIICLLATTRGKSFGVLAAYIGLLVFFGSRERIKMRVIVLVLAIGVSFGLFQIETYFANDETPRAILLSKGIQTANDYFPLGAGFASYGSNMARVHYSPLYVKYGFLGRFGMGRDTSDVNYLTDNFWPMVMGQYGWLGVVLYVFIVYQLFRIVYKINNKQMQIAALILFITLVYSSTAGPVFMNYLGCTIIATLALIMAAYNKSL